MNKKVHIAAYDPRTNITRVTYEDNTFDTFPGNVVAEKMDMTEKEVEDSIAFTKTLTDTPTAFSPSTGDAPVDETGPEIVGSTTNEINELNYEHKTTEDRGGTTYRGADTGTNVEGVRTNTESISEVESAHSGGDVRSLPVEDGHTGNVPSGS